MAKIAIRCRNTKLKKQRKGKKIEAHKKPKTDKNIKKNKLSPKIGSYTSIFRG